MDVHRRHRSAHRHEIRTRLPAPPVLALRSICQFGRPRDRPDCTSGALLVEINPLRNSRIPENPSDRRRRSRHGVIGHLHDRITAHRILEADLWRPSLRCAVSLPFRPSRNRRSPLAPSRAWAGRHVDRRLASRNRRYWKTTALDLDRQPIAVGIVRSSQNCPAAWVVTVPPRRATSRSPRPSACRVHIQPAARSSRSMVCRFSEGAAIFSTQFAGPDRLVHRHFSPGGFFSLGGPIFFPSSTGLSQRIPSSQVMGTQRGSVSDPSPLGRCPNRSGK